MGGTREGWKTPIWSALPLVWLEVNAQRKWRSEKPEGTWVLMGCYAQRTGDSQDLKVTQSSRAE